MTIYLTNWSKTQLAQHPFCNCRQHPCGIEDVLADDYRILHPLLAGAGDFDACLLKKDCEKLSFRVLPSVAKVVPIEL